jgi:hypothetical protein
MADLTPLQTGQMLIWWCCQLLRAPGMGPTTFNASKRISSDGKTRWPSTETIAKILAATGEPLADFISLTGPPKKSRRARNIKGTMARRR